MTAMLLWQKWLHWAGELVMFGGFNPSETHRAFHFLPPNTTSLPNLYAIENETQSQNSNTLHLECLPEVVSVSLVGECVAVVAITVRGLENV